MPDNAEVAEGRQVTKKRSFFRRGGTSTANRDTDVPAIPASAGEASKAAPSDAAKALQQLRTPREREHHADFEHVCDGISLQLNPATRLPNGNAKLQSTLEDWHAEVMRTIAAIESLQQAPEGAPAGAAEVRTQMYAAKSVTENMLKALKGDDNNINRAYFGRESTNLMVNISRNSEMHALAHLRIDKGHKTMHIEGLVSHPRNIFDLDGHGGVKGAARTALATIRSEAIKHGCSNIELKSLTGKSTTLYRNAGYEKDLDYWPDDDQPDMRLVLPRR